MNEITNVGCPHLTDVIYNGYEECEMGKACDLDCEWVELKRKEGNNKYKQALDEIESYCKKCNLKADFTACDILNIINKSKDN